MIFHFVVTHTHTGNTLEPLPVEANTLPEAETLAWADICDGSEMDSVEEAKRVYTIKQTLYPITDELRADFAQYSANPTVKEVIDIVGEYEHGSCDVEDVGEGITLERYAAVVRDVLLSLVNAE